MEQTTSQKLKITRKIYGIAGALTILAIPYFILLFGGNSDIETSQSYCPFKMLTGFPCPGCGITKSLVFFYEGDILKSLYYHLFGPLVVFACVAAIVVLILEIITKKEYFQQLIFSKNLAYILGISLAVYHLVRIIYFISSHSLDEILMESIWK